MISQALMPKMLMDLGNKGQASELILKLIERFLDRINTTTIHASVSEFSAICGGSLPPSPNKVTIALYCDDAGSEKSLAIISRSISFSRVYIIRCQYLISLLLRRVLQNCTKSISLLLSV